MGTAISQKIEHMFRLIEELVKGKELYAQDIQLQEKLFGKSGGEAENRKLRRYLQDIYTLYGNIILTEKKHKDFQDRRVTIYRIAKKQDMAKVFKFFLEKGNDLIWVLQMLHEQDPSLFKEMEKDALESIQKDIDRDKDVFLFRSKPFEIFETDEQKRIFSNLKKAVRNHEYRTIYSRGWRDRPIKDAKCLKLVYSQNNWYLAVETTEGKLRLLRVAFIDRLEYCKKSFYQKNVLSKYTGYFNGFENPMTLAENKKQTAILKAYPSIAKYFRKEMKPYFKSQKYLRSNEDGSIEYTQPIEIFPFVKGWLPEMEILFPATLREKLRREITASLERLR